MSNAGAYVSDTPRTDEVERKYCGTHSHWALLQHSRQLERELASWRLLAKQNEAIAAEALKQRDAALNGTTD